MPSRRSMYQWNFYIPNYTIHDIFDVRRIPLVSYCVTVTADDTPHLEGYCILPSAVPRFVQQMFLRRGQLSPAVGTPRMNVSYIQSDGDYQCSLGFVTFCYDLFGEDLFRSGSQDECGNMFLSNVPYVQTTVMDPDMPLAVASPVVPFHGTHGFRSLAADA